LEFLKQPKVQVSMETCQKKYKYSTLKGSNSLFKSCLIYFTAEIVSAQLVLRSLECCISDSATGKVPNYQARLRIKISIYSATVVNIAGAKPQTD
jgi:hypothetical protein